MSLLTVENLSFGYGRGDARAVHDVSFVIEPGEIFALLGPSGSGKTSTLRLIGGFERPLAGRIVLNGRTIATPESVTPPERRNIGFVFQEFALFPHLTVLENVTFGLTDAPKGDARRLALEILERAQLVEQADRYPQSLSGGQQQRVALARAMAPRPHLVLMDEPFGSLDAELREDARRKVHAVFRERNMSAVFVTHDQQEALSFADRIGVMNDGRLEQVGTPEELYNEPRTRFVAHFIGGANILAGEGRGDCAVTGIGRVALRTHAHGPLTVAIRPEHLELVEPSEGGPTGKVLSRGFHGHDVTVRVLLGETEITVWDDYRCRFDVGQAVQVVPREKGVVVE